MTLQLRIRQPPADGRANAAVIRAVAQWADVAPSPAAIVSGAAARQSWPGSTARTRSLHRRSGRLSGAAAVARGKDAFLGAAVSLGLAAVAAGTEIDQLSLLLNETGYHGLVHGDACPDNVRFLDGRCRIFDSGHSGWGAVVLDPSYLLAPFPSCWCFGRLPASVATPAMPAYRGRLQAAGIDLGPSWDMAMTTALGAWIVAWGTPEAVIADYPAPARPGAAQVQVPDFWQPEV